MVPHTPTGFRGWRMRVAGLTTAALLALATPTRSPPSRAADLAAGAVPATHLAIGTMTVEVESGTPGLERLLRWSFAQFAARTLDTPRVARVAFRPRDSCTGVTGWISGGDVTLCFVQEEACVDATCTAWRPWAKRTTMHELAHAWLAEHLTDDRIRRFLAVTGLPTWAGDTHPWRERGVELAAETMAWASLDPPARVNAQLGNPSCPDLARYYEALTGRRVRPAPACMHSEPPTGPSVSTRHGWVHSPDPKEPGRCGAAVSDIAGGGCSAQVHRSAAGAERAALVAKAAHAGSTPNARSCTARSPADSWSTAHRAGLGHRAQGMRSTARMRERGGAPTVGGPTTSGRADDHHGCAGRGRAVPGRHRA